MRRLIDSIFRHPLNLAILVFSPVIVKSAIYYLNSDNANNTMLGLIMLAFSLVFIYRSLWVIFVPFFSYQMINASTDTFKPERIAVLGIALTLAYIWLIFDGSQDQYTGSSFDWLISLIIMVPLLETFAGSWGKLKVTYCDGTKEIIWPKFWFQDTPVTNAEGVK